MNSQQEYELRIGVYHHPTLKTSQLIEFLQNESNDFLSSELPQNLMVRETFYASFEVLGRGEAIDLNEFIGIIVLYSSSSLETFDYARESLPAELGSDTFALLVEMDNSEKRLNVVGSGGEELGRTRGVGFIRLTLYNSEDLVATLTSSIYLMIENYYYPNEEERQRSNIECQTPNEFVLHYQDSQQKIVATSEEKQQLLGMIEQASLTRTSREREIVQEQAAIDQSIENVEKVLNNLNRHLKQKLEGEWFSSLKDSLYRPIEKESRVYNKIKLTQEWVDEPSPQKPKRSYFRTKDYHESIYNSKYNSTLQQQLRKLDSSLLKVVVVLEATEHQKVVEHRMAEVEIYENSSFPELAANALRKLNLRETERNLALMRDQIRAKVESFLRQLNRAVRQIERQRTFQRSYLAVLKK